MTDQALLPSPTAYETAITRPDLRFDALDTDIVRRARNPRDCPAHLLPWLAWDLHLDLDYRDWPEQKLRDVLHHIWQLKRSKTRDEGFRRHIALQNGEVRRITKPPQGIVALPAPTPQSEAARLARFRQLRLHTRRRRVGRGAMRAVMAHANHRGAAAGQTPAVPFLAPAMIGTWATIYDPLDDSEVGAELIEWPDADGRSVVQVYTVKTPLPPNVAARGRGSLIAFPVPKDSQIIAVKTGDLVHNPANGASRSTLAPSITPVSIVPERTVEAQTVARPRAMAHGLIAVPVQATERFTDMVRLFEPDRVPKGLKSHAVSRNNRVSMAPLTVELLVHVRHRRRRPIHSGFVCGGATMAHDPRPNRLVREATDAASAAGTETFIDFASYRPLRWSDRPKVGAFRIGDVVAA